MDTPAVIVPGFFLKCPNCRSHTFRSVATLDEYDDSEIVDVKEAMDIPPFIDIDDEMMQRIMILPDEASCAQCGAMYQSVDQFEGGGDVDRWF